MATSPTSGTSHNARPRGGRPGAPAVQGSGQQMAIGVAVLVVIAIMFMAKMAIERGTAGPAGGTIAFPDEPPATFLYGQYEIHCPSPEFRQTLKNAYLLAQANRRQQALQIYSQLLSDLLILRQSPQVSENTTDDYTSLYRFLCWQIAEIRKHK